MIDSRRVWMGLCENGEAYSGQVPVVQKCVRNEL